MKYGLWLLMTVILLGCTPLYGVGNNNNKAQYVGVMSARQAYSKVNASHYTIQVLALQEKKDIHNYIQSVNAQFPVWVNWKFSRGARWYTVIVGDFPSKNEAYTALMSLPHHVKQSHPFIVRFANLQQKQQTSVIRIR